MMLIQRACEACGQFADGAASAHFARVVWLCELHSAEFHAPELQRVLRTPGASTRAIWAAIDLWLRTTITIRLVEGRLRLVGVDHWQRVLEVGT